MVTATLVSLLLCSQLLHNVSENNQDFLVFLVNYIIIIIILILIILFILISVRLD